MADENWSLVQLAVTQAGNDLRAIALDQILEYGGHSQTPVPFIPQDSLGKFTGIKSNYQCKFLLRLVD